MSRTLVTKVFFIIALTQFVKLLLKSINMKKIKPFYQRLHNKSIFKET